MNLKYLVVEIQTNSDGTVGNITSAFDTENEAWSKYYDVLKYAAISSLPMHSAVLLANDGNMLAQRCFRHGSN